MTSEPPKEVYLKMAEQDANEQDIEDGEDLADIGNVDLRVDE